MKGSKEIKVHMDYNIKNDGKRKLRLVARGHLTGTPIGSVYSTVISLRGLRIVICLVKLNKMKIWSTNVKMHIWRHTPKKKSISLVMQFLEPKKNIVLSL